MKERSMWAVGVASGFLLIGCLLIGPAQATTILEVGLSGYPYTSIQAAINDAVAGDEVRVQDGTYYEKIILSGKAITVKSVNGPSSTTIDGSSSGSVVSGGGSGSVLEGFTITNGNAFYGGGIYCASSPTITNCTVTGNRAFRGGGIYTQGSATITNCTINENAAPEGGGIYLYGSSSTIINCTITGNSATDGGGIYCNYSHPSVTNCIVIKNSATDEGGGIYCNYSHPSVTNCTVTENSGIYGLGIYCYASSPTITNCTISKNSNFSGRSKGGGIYCDYFSSPSITNCTITGNLVGDTGGGIYCSSSSPTITNCTIAGNDFSLYGGGIACSSSSPKLENSIVWGNSEVVSSCPEIWLEKSTITVTYSDVDQDGYAGSNGNIRQDPLFVNPANGDFHLQPTSPCIDAATSDNAPLTDMVGNPRFDAPWIENTGEGIYPYYDMGALEYLNPCEGDFDGDGDVDGMDLSEFSTGQFDGDDLGAFALEFGKTDCMD